jgi:hypothetical protein
VTLRRTGTRTGAGRGTREMDRGREGKREDRGRMEEEELL